MKKVMAVLMMLCMMLAAAAAWAQETYPDGIYRGFYYDGGIEQIAIQFEMKDNIFQSIVYRGVKYKDGDYLIEDASDAQKATLAQYRQMADYLIGKGVDAIADLYMPYDIVEDVDALKKYLGSKEGGVTLGKLREEDADVPTLVVGKSGLYLPPQ